MYFYRTRNLELVEAILAHPEIYPHIGDDYSPAIEDFMPNPHPAIWYVVPHNEACEKVGMFVMVPQNRICWEIHAAMLPDSLTEDKWEAARMLPCWLGKNTECKRLTAAVPSSNRPAIMYGIHGLGMRFVGRQHQAFMKYGQLQDLIILGRSICPA